MSNHLNNFPFWQFRITLEHKRMPRSHLRPIKSESLEAGAGQTVVLKVLQRFKYVATVGCAHVLPQIVNWAPKHAFTECLVHSGLALAAKEGCMVVVSLDLDLERHFSWTGDGM